MKKILWFVIILTAASCTVDRKLTTLTKNTTPKLQGSVGFAGIQLERKAVKWDRTAGNTLYRYSIDLATPEIVLASMKDFFPSELSKKISYTPIAEADQKAFMDQHYKGENLFMYSKLEKDILIYDDLKKAGAIDSAALEVLNKAKNNDYYLLLVGDIEDHSMKSLFNGFSASVTPKITIILFSKSGEKIFTKSYSREYTGIKDNDEEPFTYLKYFLIMVDHFKPVILNDLRFLSEASDATSVPSFRQFQEETEKTIKARIAEKKATGK